MLNLPVDCFFSILQRGSLWELWYLGALLLLYMILPFIAKSTHKEKQQAFFLCVIISEAIQVISMIRGKPIQSYICQTLCIWTWLVYLLLGAELRRICGKVKKSITLKWHYCGYIHILILSISVDI